jgi:hypothetical protein
MNDAATATGRWTIHLPGFHPTKLNQLLTSHWATAGRLKKRDLRTIQKALWVYPVPMAKGKRRLTLIITLGKGERGADPDAFFKVVCDSLVHLGLLVDDNRQGVELSPVVFERGAERATTIILEDLS